MVGAINFLNDALRICDSRSDCKGCPCTSICRGMSLRHFPRENVAGLVHSVTVAAKELDDQLAKTVCITRYNREYKYHPAEGGCILAGEIPQASVSIPSRDVDSFLEGKCREILAAFGMSTEDIVEQDAFRTKWKKGKDVVVLQKLAGKVAPVSDFKDCGETPDGEYRERYHAFLSCYEDYQSYDERADRFQAFRYIPESIEGMHTVPLIYS